MKRSVYRAKKRFRKTPAGRTTFKIKPKKHSAAKCGLCSRRLQGVPRCERGARTRRKPERVFGGMLCASCTQNVVKTKARLSAGVLNENEVPLTVLRYVTALKRV